MAFEFVDDTPQSAPAKSGFEFVDEPKQVRAATTTETVPMNSVGNRQLPPLWDVNIGGTTVRSVYDPDAKAYLVPNRNGPAHYIAKDKSGALTLREMGSKRPVRLQDIPLGVAQGLNDVINTGAEVIGQPIANLVGLGPDSAATEWLHEKTGMQKSARDLADFQQQYFDEYGNSIGGDIGRFGGQVIGTLPAGEIKASELLAQGVGRYSPALAEKVAGGLVGRTVNGAAQGGAAAAMTASARPDEAPDRQAAAGGLAGGVTSAVLPPVLRGAANAVTRLLPASESAAAEIGPQAIEAGRAAAAKLGISWDGLKPELQQNIAGKIAEAQKVGADLRPEALVRQALYEGQGLIPTRALVTRDRGDASLEQNLLTENEPSGEALRDIYAQNNAAVRNRIKELAPQGVEPVEKAEFGAAIRKPVARGERKAQAATQRAWEAANTAEGMNELTPAPLLDYWRRNAEALAKTEAGANVIQHMRDIGVLSPANAKVTVATSIPMKGGASAVQGAAKYEAGQFGQMARAEPPSRIGESVGGSRTIQYRPVNADDAAGLSPKVNNEFSFAFGNQQRQEPLTLRQLQSLRQIVNEEWKTAKGTARLQLNQMRDVLNGMEEGAGGELFKAYRNLRTEKGARYEDNPIIDKLLSDKKGYYGTDQIEDSEVFDKIILGQSPEQLGKLWPRLSPKARDLTKAQVADWLEKQVYSKQSMNRDEVIASAAKMADALDKLGSKTKLIYGPEKAAELKLLQKSLREISNPPEGTKILGSSAKNSFLVNRVLSLTGKVPGLRDISAGARELVERGVERRQKEQAAAAAQDIMGPYRRQAAKRASSQREEEIGRGIASPAALLFPALF